MTMSLHPQAWSEQGTDEEERPPPISMGILAVLVVLPPDCDLAEPQLLIQGDGGEITSPHL